MNTVMLIVQYLPKTSYFISLGLSSLLLYTYHLPYPSQDSLIHAFLFKHSLPVTGERNRRQEEML